MSSTHPQGNSSTGEAANGAAFGMSVDKDGLIHLFVATDRVTGKQSVSISASPKKPVDSSGNVQPEDNATPLLPVDEGDHLDVSRAALTYYLGSQPDGNGNDELPKFVKSMSVQDGGLTIHIVLDVFDLHGRKLKITAEKVQVGEAAASDAGAHISGVKVTARIEE